MRRPFLLILAVAACSNMPTVPSTPSALHVFAGDGQSGIPGYRLANPVAVKLVDDAGHPAVGDTVRFTPSDASGMAEPAFAVTDSSGIARTYWRLGGTLGTQTLAGQVAVVPAVGTATITATAASNYMVSIDGGYAGLCGVDIQGQLACWKPPEINQPDDGGHFVPVNASVRFTKVTVPVNVQRTSIGNPLSGQGAGCALTDAGRVWCFTLDTLASVVGFAELPGAYPALSQIVSADEVASYCGLTAAGEAWCWGANNTGQLGDGTTAAHAAPARVSTAARFVQMDMDNHSCAVTATGEAWCWGSNDQQQSGSSAAFPVLVPAQVNSALHFSKVKIDEYLEASCGFVDNGGMYCWGNTQELGSETSAAPPTQTPIAIATASQPLDMVVSSGIHFQFNRNASIQWSGFAGFRGAVEGGSGGATHLIRSSIINLLRDVQIAHGYRYICGTAALGEATLCPSTVGLIDGRAGFSMPMVVGVPFPQG
jgi:Regulator of Chromosome Condensation (RCC1) repeat protein